MDAPVPAAYFVLDIAIVVGGGAHAGLDPLTILLRELKVHGSFIYVDEFDQVIRILADSALRVARPRSAGMRTNAVRLSQPQLMLTGASESGTIRR